jgi:hypothetical protein
MEFRVFTNNNNYYKKYVEALNGLFKLTDRELDIFAELLRFQIERKDTIDLDVIDRRSRRTIMQRTHTTKSNLCKYLANLKDKKVLVQVGDNWLVNPYLIPSSEQEEIKFIFE